MMIHSLAIEHNASRGQRVYDPVADEYEYRWTIGAYSGELDWIVSQRD